MKTNVLRKTISMVLSMLFILSCFPALPTKAEAAAPGIYDLTISNTDQQTVKGWGVFPAWNRADWNSNLIDKTGAKQALYNDLGATLFRYMLPVVNGDADGNVIDAKMQEMYDLINVGEARGKHDYTISVWSPPVGMKTLPTVNGWTGTEHVMLRADKEDAYARYLVNAIKWLMAKGSSAPKSISIQNEPLSQIISEWCYWGGDNGAQYQRVTKLLRTKLDTAGLVNVQIISAEGAAYDENEQLLGTGFSALKNDAALGNAIGGFASHSYIKKGFSTVDMYKAYTNAADSFPAKDKWQTEYSTLIEGNSEQDMAINTAQRLAGDMALVKNNYWLWWLGWSAGRHPTDWGEVLLDGDGYTVTKSKAFSVLSKVFNNVPVGSKVRRVTADSASGLTTSDAIWMDAVAFVNGTKTTALLVNSTDTGKKVNVKGLTGVTANVYQMSSNVAKGADMSLVGALNINGGTASYIDLPAKSVTVIVTSDTDTAPPYITFDQSSSSSVTDASYAVRSPQFALSGRLDEAGTLQVNGVSVPVGGDFRFKTVVNLQPGVNTISAVAKDSLGNTGSPQTLYIRHDPSYLGLTLDQGSLVYVNQSDYAISGSMNGDAAVRVKQQFGGSTVTDWTYNAVAGPNSMFASFGTTLQLREGDNTVTASAYNSLGQQAVPVTIHAIYDKTPPVITVPAAGATTSTSYVLKGSVNETAVVKVNGSNVNLAAGNMFTVIVPVTKGLNTIRIEAVDLAGNTSQAIVQVTCNPVEDGALAKGVAAANKAKGLIAINGDLTKPVWNINNRVEKMITGISDNSVTFGTLWDDTYLYVGVRVLDVNLVRDPAKPAYQNDSVEIYIDGDGNRSSIYDRDDHQITLGWHDSQLAVDGNIPGIRFAQQDIEGGYTVEMAIPWSGIGISTPKAGAVFGFDVGNNDNDGHNNGFRESQIMWNGSGDNWQNASAFGSMYLSDGRNSAAAVAPSGAITINGMLDESSWALVNHVTKNTIGTSDNSVRFGTLADNQYLYVGVEVLDADLRKDDSVEVYIDANNSRSAFYDTFDHQIKLGWHDNQLSMIGNIPGIQFAQKDINGGYSVEMAIPWTGLNVTPTRDMTIGFDVGNNDTDGYNGGLRKSQLMWNGSVDNWQNTSAFGSLLLHNSSYPLPQITEPSGLAVFTDEGADLNKLYYKTANIITANWLPEYFAGDADRIAHKNDNPGAGMEYVIYKSPYGDIYSFDVTTGLFDNSPFSFYGSADGVIFTQLTAASTLVGGASGYSVYSNKASNLTAGIRYLKIAFPGKANWQEQLNKVAFKYFPDKSSDPNKAVFTDEGADLTKLYAKSGHIGLASWLPEYFGNDSTRIIHTNDHAIDPEFIIYKSPATDIDSFDITVSAFVNLPASSVFAIYGSPDGVSFDRISVIPALLFSTSGYNTLAYRASSVPKGYRYLKVEFPYGTLDCDNWTSHIDKVSFVYGIVRVTGVALDQTALSLNIGSTAKLTAALAPADATNKSVTWSSSNSAVAAVDGNGTVTAAGIGTAVITVTTVDGAKSADCTVKVLPVLQQVTLSADKTVLKSGGTAKLTVSGVMSDGTAADLSVAQIVYTSDNAQFVKVDGNGIVTAAGEGRATVTVSVYLRGVTQTAALQIVADFTPPVTYFHPDKADLNGWYNSDVTVTLSGSDNLSGVDKTEYRIGVSSSWTVYTVPFTLANEGVFTVQFRSADKAGNVEDVKQQTVRIDKTAPVSVSSVNPIAPTGSNGWYASDVTLSLSATDSLSGVTKTVYQVNNGVWVTYNGPIPAFSDGVYKVNYGSTDNAGNVEQIKTVEFKIDKTAPILTVQLDKSVIAPLDDEKMAVIHATLNASDATSGVASVILTSITSYKLEKDQGEQNQDPKKVDFIAALGTSATTFSVRAEEGYIYTITYTITDNAGNKATAVSTVSVIEPKEIKKGE